MTENKRPVAGVYRGKSFGDDIPNVNPWFAEPRHDDRPVEERLELIRGAEQRLAGAAEIGKLLCATDDDKCVMGRIIRVGTSTLLALADGESGDADVDQEWAPAVRSSDGALLLLWPPRPPGADLYLTCRHTATRNGRQEWNRWHDELMRLQVVHGVHKLIADRVKGPTRRKRRAR